MAKSAWSGFSPQFFVLDVYNSDGSPLTVDQLYMQLEKIWNSSLQTNKEPIGILTSQHRNTWGKAYNNLIKGEQSRDKNLKILHRNAHYQLDLFSL